MQFDLPMFIIFMIILGLVGLAFYYRHKYHKYVADNGAVIDQYNQWMTGTTLFTKYGGLTGVQAVVDAAGALLTTDPITKGAFTVVGQPGHDTLPQLLSSLDLFFAFAFGAPVYYDVFGKGGYTFTRGVCFRARGMIEAHTGLNLSKTVADRFLVLVAQAAKSCGVTDDDVATLVPTLEAINAVSINI